MSLIQLLEGLEAPLLAAIEPVILAIVGAQDPYAAIDKARRGLEMDTLDAAADAAVDEALKVTKP